MKRAAKEAPRLRKITLAEKLGVSRPTLDKYLEMDGAPGPDAEKTYDVEEVLKWVGAHAEQSGANHRDGTKKTLNDWRAEKLALECDKLRHLLEVERGDYISKREAAATVIPLMTELDALIKQKYELELPSRYVGKDAVECAELNAAARDQINARFRQGVKPLTE